MPTSHGADVVLINPGARTAIYQALGKRLTAVENPVWAGLMATFVRKQGYEPVIIDAEADELAPEEIAEKVADINPRLVVIVVYGHQPSASTQNMTGASLATTAVRRRLPNAKILMVGGHVAALPDRTLQEEACDYVAHDEGLQTIVDLIEADKQGDTDLSKIRGLAYWSGGALRQFRTNTAAPLVKDLDTTMPGIAWDLLPMPKYRAHNWHTFGHLERQPYAALYTTLGCPYKCSFCCIQAPFKAGEKELGLKETVNSYRFWTPERVIGEIDHLVNTYGVRNIKFADEMFVMNVRHVAGICDLIIERGYDLNIWAYARVDTVKDGMLDKLKRAGFNWLAFGIEAASDKVLNDVDKRYEIAQVYETIGKVKAAGINIIGNYIFGLPEDDLETMQETLDLALELNTEFANFYSAMAYPGSQLYKQASANGWALPTTWSGYSQHAVDTLPLPTRHLPAGEVLKFRDHAFQQYFTHAPYLQYVDRRFGADTVAHIQEMTAHRLERKFVVA
jgi:radical SAM superfamily enzyme YgiQ (UPF0313 family)